MSEPKAPDRLREMLIRHEGYKKYPYRCPMGKITIGIGRNLEGKGLTDDEIILLFENDIHECVDQASKTFPWFETLGVPRQDVIISMIFNLGLRGFQKFKHTILAIEKGDFHEAAKEMLQSTWAVQVGDRATELAHIMRHGIYPK